MQNLVILKQMKEFNQKIKIWFLVRVTLDTYYI